MNQLVVNYKFGHQRVVNLDKSFFEVEKKTNNKFKTQTVTSKAIDLANYLDKDPYIIELIENGKTVIKLIYHQNNPENDTSKSN